MSPVLYLLPGLLCDRIVWADQARDLADLAEIRIPSFYGFDTLEAMARSVLDEAPERFAVAGHSMGARVALSMVAMAPERVTRLALLDTGVTPAGEGEAARRGALVALAQAEGMAALAARWLPPMVHPDAPARDPALMATLAAMVCRATPEIFAGQQRALLGRPDMRPTLASIACPTLVGAGAQDMWSPVAQHQPIAAAIPGARLDVWPDSGHMAPMEAPDAVSRSLRRWLSEASA